MDLDQGFHNTEYVESISIEEGVISKTGNELYRIGYSLLCEGNIECYIDPKDNLRKARIFR